MVTEISLFAESQPQKNILIFLHNYDFGEKFTETWDLSWKNKA